jgi:putative hydrolase of the HAD superfamily
MNNSNISVIVFDLGNVLIPFNYKIILERLNNLSPGLGDKFSKLYAENYHVHRQFEKWELTNEQFIEIMLSWVDNKITEEDFCVLYSDIFEENKRTTALLPILKQKYKLVLLSNTNDIHKKYGWDKYDFIKHFDKLILSHEVGAIKPEPAIYKAVEKFTCLAPEQHIFIDDIADYAEGARKMGWDAIQFTGHDNLILEFNKRGII